MHWAGPLILFLLLDVTDCYLFLYLLVDKNSNLSNRRTNCEIGFNYKALLITLFPLFFFLELILLYHLEYRDFYCIGQLILFLLDRCYTFLYLLVGKYSNLSNGTNCNFEIGFNYNALLII